MKRKNISSIYNYVLLAIIILLIPIIDFNNKFMVAIVGVIAATLLVDGIITLKNFIWFKQEERYIKSLTNQIDSFYNPMHIYFSNTYKNYPDNSYEIASAAYMLLLGSTDMNENEYKVFITMGAIGDLGRPFHWITAFARDDYYYEYPFIIDVNTIMHKANRNVPFDEVLKTYRPVIISVNDKEYKNYRAYQFMEVEDDEHRSTLINKREVHIKTIEEKNISSVDVKLIRDSMNTTLRNNIIRITESPKFRAP